MTTYREPARDLPVSGEYDVIVAGAGPAGIGAALSAAREGADTLLIEQFGDVGGVSTVGLMSHWTGRTKGGIYEEILEKSNDADESMLEAWSGYRQTINPERLKTVYLDMLEDAGVHLRLYTFIADVVMEDDRLQGIITESKSGREVFHAKMCIDATGDGDVACKAGVPFTKGREEDGKMQPMSLMFKVAGVDTDKAVFPGGFESNMAISGGGIQDLGRARLPHPLGHVLLYRTTLPGVVTCNMTNIIDVDGTNAEDLTKAHVDARRQIERIVEFLRTTVPGFERCYVIDSANYIGIRETRHFRGEYTLTKDDILEARIFDDWVVSFAHFNFDVHNISGAGLDATGAQKKFPQRRGYTIPYRCLLPRGVKNLLLAGRNISGTHMAHSNYRVMPICANIGQAAGIAAALSARTDTPPEEIDIELLQDRLLQNGVLDPNKAEENETEYTSIHHR